LRDHRNRQRIRSAAGDADLDRADRALATKACACRSTMPASTGCTP
jgi:hypothetical protein